jgi:hypothetical protein
VLAEKSPRPRSLIGHRVLEAEKCTVTSRDIATGSDE